MNVNKNLTILSKQLLVKSNYSVFLLNKRLKYMKKKGILAESLRVIRVSFSVSEESIGLRSKLLRKVEELKSCSVSSDVPDEFLCPITRELMKEPVIAAGKFTHMQKMSQ